MSALSMAACAAPAPAPRAPPPPAPIVAPPPPTPRSLARCSDASRVQAETLADRDAAAGAAALQAELTCPNVPATTYVLLADLQSGLGDPAAALQTLRRATRQHPDSTLAWRALGRTAREQGMLQAGLQALERARDLAPSDPEIAAELARAYRKRGDQDDAAAGVVAPLLAKAEVRFDAKDPAGAVAILRSALPAAKGAPRVRADVWRRLALVHLAAGELAQARQAAESGLADALAPDALRGALLVTHADICLAQDRPDDALISATAASEITPRDPLAHANVALSRALRQEWTQAVDALAHAIEAGLPNQLAKAELLGLAGFAAMRDRPAFQALVRRGWPGAGDKPTRDR